MWYNSFVWHLNVWNMGHDSKRSPCGSCLVVIHCIVKGSHLRIVDYIDVDAVLDEHVDDLCPSVYCREVDGCVCVSMCVYVCVRERERERRWVSACVHTCMYVCINYVRIHYVCINYVCINNMCINYVCIHYTNDAVLDEHVDYLCPSVYCREVNGCVCVSMCVCVCVWERKIEKESECVCTYMYVCMYKLYKYV